MKTFFSSQIYLIFALLIALALGCQTVEEWRAFSLIIGAEISAIILSRFFINEMNKSTNKMSPLRDGLTALGAQICVGFAVIGIYFAQF